MEFELPYPVGRALKLLQLVAEQTVRDSVEPSLYPHVNLDWSRYSGPPNGIGEVRLSFLRPGLGQVEVLAELAVDFQHYTLPTVVVREVSSQHLGDHRVWEPAQLTELRQQHLEPDELLDIPVAAA